MKRIVTMLTFLLLISTASALTDEKVEMYIELNDGSDHVTILTANPSGLQELKNIINEPTIRSIYRERLTSVFGDIENLNIFIEGENFIIEFDCVLTRQEDGKWVVERADFDGVLGPASTLKIVLPEGYELVDADTTPHEIKKGRIIWNDLEYVPALTYGKKSLVPDKSFPIKQTAAGILIVLVIFSLVRLRGKSAQHPK